MKKYVPLFANLAASVLFGFTFMFIKQGMAVVNQDTVKFLAFRFVLAFLSMSVLVLLRIKKVHYKKETVWLVVACGLINPLISQVLETTSTTYAPTAQIAIFMSLLPITLVIINIFVNHEYPTGKQVFFVLLSVVGVLFTSLVDGQMAGSTTIGVILLSILIFVVSFGRALVRKAAKSYTSFEIIYMTTGMGAIGFTITTLFQHRHELNHFFDGLWCWDFVIPVIYMAIGSSVLGFLLMTYASAHLPVAVFAATNTLNNVVVILAGVFILHEEFRPVDIVGTIIIMASIIGVSLCYNTKDPVPAQEKDSSPS